MIVSGRGIHRDIGNDLPVNLHIDLIDPTAQILVMIRHNAIVFQQALFKLDLPFVVPGRSLRSLRQYRLLNGCCRLPVSIRLPRFFSGRKRKKQQRRTSGGGKGFPFHVRYPPHFHLPVWHSCGKAMQICSLPALYCAVIVPFIFSTSSFAIDSPSPVAFWAVSMVKNRSNRRSA